MPTIGTLKSKRALAVRHHGPTSQQALDAKRDLAAAKLAEHIKRVVDDAPPLTAEQRSRLVELLRPARSRVVGAA